VQEALEISKKFGETSPEARAAWDIVEELDASNRYGRFSDFMVRFAFCERSFSFFCSRCSCSDNNGCITYVAYIQFIHHSHHKPVPEQVASTVKFVIPSEPADSSEQRKQALQDGKRVTEEYMKQAPAVGAPEKLTFTFETPSEQREQALADAKRITEEKGVTSPEAALAWELVEELDATAAHHRTTGQG
jgi:hypothetical protein